MSRPSWDSYFIKIAYAVAERSTCNRAHVGCVLVKEGHILTTGFNGSPKGQPHCNDVGHPMKNDHCIRTVHAEANAVIQAALHGVSTKGATVYLTHFPCYTCAKMLINAGVIRVVFEEWYGESRVIFELLKTANIGVNRV